MIDRDGHHLPFETDQDRHFLEMPENQEMEDLRPLDLLSQTSLSEAAEVDTGAVEEAISISAIVAGAAAI